MENLVIGKKVFSIHYGEGVITKAEDGLIWIDFFERKEVCFQATAALATAGGVLTYTDENISKYLKHIEAMEKKQKLHYLAVECLKKLQVPSMCMDDFQKNGVVYLITGKKPIAIADTQDEKLIKGLDWYRENHDGYVYAAVAIPNFTGDGLFTYAYLTVDSRKKDVIDDWFKVRGNYAWLYTFYQNINFYSGGENRPLALHLTENGIYAMPEIFENVVEKIISNDRLK